MLEHTKYRKSEALVLKKRRILHNDSIIWLFSKEYGIVSIIAKGIYSLKSKRISALQTGNLILFHASVKKNSWYLTESKLVSYFSTIKSDPERTKRLYLFLYIISHLLPEEEKDLLLYEKVKKAIIHLAGKGTKPGNDIIVISWMLNHLGYGVHASFDECRKLIEQITGRKIPSHII